MARPEIAVVVPSHARPLRLRWLLNALEEQTLSRGRFEVVVCHEAGDTATAAVLANHPLAPRALRVPPGTGTPGRQRNAGWRAAQAPLVLFTDDDCRPPREWVERALAAAQGHPGAVVQGATRPDPDEGALLHAAAHVHTQEVDPPVHWGQTCNVLYPRAALERLGGFDEEMDGGEDAELAYRARAAGIAYAGAPDMLTFHAVEPASLRAAARAAWRWRHLPTLAARHPELRDQVARRHFWKERHARLPLALAGLALAPRRPAAVLLALPWAASALPSYGGGARGRVRALGELPGRLALDATEFAALAYGSVRARTVFL